MPPQYARGNFPPRGIFVTPHEFIRKWQASETRRALGLLRALRPFLGLELRRECQGASGLQACLDPLVLAGAQPGHAFQ